LCYQKKYRVFFKTPETKRWVGVKCYGESDSARKNGVSSRHLGEKWKLRYFFEKKLNILNNFFKNEIHPESFYQRMHLCIAHLTKKKN